MWVLQITWRSAGALPAQRIQSYKHTAPPELGRYANYIITDSTVFPSHPIRYKWRLLIVGSNLEAQKTV